MALATAVDDGAVLDVFGANELLLDDDDDG